MRVAPDIHLVASGVQGFGLTDDLDCNCWLFDAGEGLVLFDAGAGLDVEGILGVMREDGLDPARLTHLLLTHAHADHSGGAAEVVRRTGCRLLCGAATAELLGRGEAAISLAAARAAGGYPAGYPYAAPIPDGALADGGVVAVGRARITALATPGHSLDHMSFLVEGVGAPALVTGDAMMHSGRIIYQDIYDFDVRRSGDSIRRLAALDFDALLPGHGLFARAGGRRHAAAAVARLDGLRTPLAVDFVPL